MRLREIKRKISLADAELNSDLASILQPHKVHQKNSHPAQRKLRIALKRPGTTPYQNRFFFAPKLRPPSCATMDIATGHALTRKNKSIENQGSKFTSFIIGKQPARVAAAERSVLENRSNNPAENVDLIHDCNKTVI